MDTSKPEINLNLVHQTIKEMKEQISIIEMKVNVMDLNEFQKRMRGLSSSIRTLESQINLD